MLNTWSGKVWTSLSHGGLPDLPAKKYIVDLTTDEREQLLHLIRRGKPSARKVARARILLQAANGLTDDQIAVALHTGEATVERTRKRFVEEGLGALNERPRPGGRRKFTGKEEAHLIAVACTPAPEGRQRWTLRLLAGKVVELGLADTCSYETVRRVLKKTNSSRGRNNSGASRK
jgi:transposase